MELSGGWGDRKRKMIYSSVIFDSEASLSPLILHHVYLGLSLYLVMFSLIFWGFQ